LGGEQLIKFLILVASLSLVAAGCAPGTGDDGLTQEQTSSGDRTTDIVKKSGGDWSKVTPADKEYLQKLANGNEKAAQMRFQMMANRSMGTAAPTMPGGGGPPPRK
jgi:hypothetical protein